MNFGHIDFSRISHTTIAVILSLGAVYPVANLANASSYARTDVTKLTVKVTDLDAADGVTSQIERFNLGTRGISLGADNWDNYQEPTRYTQTVASPFTPGSGSISNSYAAGSISVVGDVFSIAGANISTVANAYGAPAHALPLGTFVSATQDNLTPANQYFRLTPKTKVEINGQIVLEGSMTATPHPYSQTATSLVFIMLGQGTPDPIVFSEGLSFLTTITQIEGEASSYRKVVPFSLQYTNDSSSYIDNFTLRFIVEAVAKTNEVSAVPEPSVFALILCGVSVVFVSKRKMRTKVAPGEQLFS